MKPITLIKQIINFIIFIIISWISIHLLAVFGLLLVFTLPVFQLLFPKTICFYCRIKHHKHHSSHLLINVILIFVATLLSLALVYGEAKLFTYLGLPFAKKTVQFVIQDKNEYKIGEIFPMKIEIKGIKVPINIIRTDIQFDPDLVEVIDIDTSSSFATIFIQKDINNELGYARLTGGIPNPGWSDPTGVYATVYLRGKSSGLVVIDFLPTSQVLANNGKGTNVLLNLAKASYYITPDSISPSESHLQQQLIRSISSILGQATGSATQLTFTGYADPIPPLPLVLGNQTTLITRQDSLYGASLLDTIHRIDNAIITFILSYISPTTTSSQLQ